MNISPVLSSNGSPEQASVKKRLESLYYLREYPPVLNMRVVKMTNIPFDVSTEDILAFFSPLRIPFGHVAPHYTTGIHIPMEKSTGKTIAECFVELANDNDVYAALKIQKYVKGRLISVVESTQEELFQSLFPSFGSNGCANEVFDLIPGLESSRSLVQNEDCFLSQSEINGILMVCKRFKLHYSRKCAERPFELVISILSKVPWHQTSVISLIQRDHLFEMFKIAVESLVIHLSKSSKRYLERSLLVRLVRSGLAVPLFTEKQKLTVLSVSRLVCPKDLEPFVFNPPEVHELEDSSPKTHAMPHISEPMPIIDNSYQAPFQTPSTLSSHTNRTSTSQIEKNLSRFFPSPVSSVRQSDHSPWSSPASSTRAVEEKIKINRLYELERKVQDYVQQLKNAHDQMMLKDTMLSDLHERNSKLRDKLKSCIAFMKSLQRRNDELEYLHFKRDKRIWGSNGLHMEYNSCTDM